jgi:hypothetical protein
MTYAGESPSVAEGVIIVFTPIEKSEQVSISTKDDLHQLKEFGSDLDKKRVIVLINKL